MHTLPAPWIASILLAYMDGRSIRCQGRSFDIFGAVPQGGILSPLIFAFTMLAVTEKIRTVMHGTVHHLSLYADDVGLIMEDHFEKIPRVKACFEPFSIASGNPRSSVYSMRATLRRSTEFP